MFSTSTIASSTSIPTTSDSASSVTMLMVNPNRYMPMKVGITASGSADRRHEAWRASRAGTPHHQHGQHGAFESMSIEPS